MGKIKKTLCILFLLTRTTTPKHDHMMENSEPSTTIGERRKENENEKEKRKRKRKEKKK